jgi:hypothetical protein
VSCILTPSTYSFQWVVLTRKHVEVVVGDKNVLQVFRRHCKVCCYSLHVDNKMYS